MEDISRIPVVQQSLLDSVGSKFNQLGALAGGYGDSLALPARQQLFWQQLKKLKTAGQEPFSLVTSLPGWYSLKQLPAGFKKPAFSFDVQELSSQNSYDPTQQLAGGRVASQSGGQFSFTVAGVPFEAQGYWQPTTIQGGDGIIPLFKVSFDRTALLTNLRKNVTSRFDAPKLLLKDFDFKETFQRYARLSLDGVKNSFRSTAGLLPSKASLLESLTPEEFLSQSAEQLQERLIPALYLDSLGGRRENLLQQRQMQTNPSLTQPLDSQIKQVDFLLGIADSLKRQLLSAKRQFEAGSLNYNEVVRYQTTVNTTVQSIIDSDHFVQEASRNLLQLNGLTKLFLYAREFNLGKFSPSWSPQSLSGVFATGAGGSFLKGNRFGAFQMSGVQPLAWAKDQAFAGVLGEIPQHLQAIRLGKGGLEGAHSHVSLVNATTKKSPADVLSVVPRNVFVGALSKQLSFGAIGVFDLEAAKSANQYRNTSSGGDNTLESKMALQYLGADFLQTLSLGLQYTGSFPAASFEPGFFIKYSGLGYQNPASTAVANGTLAYGTTFRKAFRKGKLTLHSRLSRRATRTGLEKDERFVQVQNTLGMKYRLNPKLRLGLDWTGTSLQKGKGPGSVALYASNRLNANTSFRGKLRALPFFQYLALGYQNLLFPTTQAALSGKLLWVTSSSQLSLSRGTLFTTLQLYKALQPTATPGNFITLESGLSYQVLKKVNLSTSVLYMDQGVITRQVGVKQSVSTSVGRHLSLNFFGDLTGNLQRNLNPLLFPNSRGEMQIAYKLN
jgi:hypothetical protein